MEIKGVQGQTNHKVRQLPSVKFKETGYNNSLDGIECQPLRFRKSLLERIKNLFKRTP